MKKALAIATLSIVVISLSITYLDAGEKSFKEYGEPENVIIISIDSLRADRLNPDYQRSLAPNMAEFREDSYYFSNAYSNSPWTLPSHSTVLTGKYPSETGALHYNYTMCDSTVTLAEELKRKEFKTFAATGGGTLAPLFGFDQGFDRYRDDHRDLQSGNFKEGLEFLEELRGQSFVFLHGFDAHFPYVVPNSSHLKYGKNYNGSIMDTSEELNAAVRTGRYDSPTEAWILSANMSTFWADNMSDSGMQHMIDSYDNQVHYFDSSFGNFMKRLKQQGKYENSLIIVIGDHGEELGEHGKQGHSRMYEETIRVPLIVKFPSQQTGETVEEKVELRDIYATVKKASGLETSNEGIPLQEIVAGKRAHKAIYAERLEKKMVLKEGYKLIWYNRNWFPEKPYEMFRQNSEYRLFNLEKDPEEKRNLIDEKPERAAELKQILENRYPDRDTAGYCDSGYREQLERPETNN